VSEWIKEKNKIYIVCVSIVSRVHLVHITLTNLIEHSFGNRVRPG